MPITIEISAGGIPAGVYPGEFARAELYESDNGFPPAFKLIWKINAGEHEGLETSRIVSRKTGPKANLPKFLKMLSGREFQPGDKVDLESFYGTRGTVVVEDVENGTRVMSFMREAPASTKTTSIA